MILILNFMAYAEPYDIIIDDLDPTEYDLILEDAVGSAPNTATEIRVWTYDDWGQLVLANSLRPEEEPVPDKEAIQAPWGGIDAPGLTNGFLSSKGVYVSQAHGWIWYDSLNRFSTQRGILHQTVEDFHNAEGADFYLEAYLENAGAKVFTARERGHNSNSAIADNDGEGYTEIGTGFSNGGSGFKDTSPYVYGENPFASGSTRQFSSTGGGIAQWIPEVPENGYYTVYVSWDSNSSNSPAAHYRISHLGGVIDRYFDQRTHGSTWQYVETLYLEEGVDTLTVELIGDGDDNGSTLSADAVRIGGGVGDVMRNGTTTNRPRWESGALLYTQFNGAPPSVYDAYGDGNGYDPSSRSRWADWEHPAGEDAVYLSWHSNAGGGTGTSTYIHDNPYSGSLELATFVQDELVDAIKSQWDSSWYDRGVKSAAFAEVSSVSNNEMPAALVELAFHDDEYDASLLRHPIFRRDAARAMYRGIVQYFAQNDGVSPKYLPEPPSHLMAMNTNDSITVEWSTGPSGAPFGDPATSYRVYSSADGRSWNNGSVVQSASYTTTLDPNELRFFRVSAINNGGISFPSETVSVRRDPLGEPPILIVSAFDRLEDSNLFWEDASPVGSVKRFDPRYINAYDTTVPHAHAFDLAGYSFDTVSDELLSDVNLSQYLMVVWVGGEESTSDSTFTNADQTQIQSFWESGGALWVSGAEILWDLDEKGSVSDKQFAETVFGSLMESDDAGTERASGIGLLDALNVDFSVAAGSPYNVEYPDVLATSRDSILEYSTGGIAANLGDNVVFFGFPFECIGDEGTRVEIASRLLAVLLEGYEIPDVPDEPSSEPANEPTNDPATEPSNEPSSEQNRPSKPGEDKAGCGCSSTSSSPLQVIFIVMAVLCCILSRREKDHAQ